MNSISVEDIYKNVGQMIKQVRQNHKPSISQQTLARKAGLSRTSIVNIEKGKHHIQIHTLYYIAQSLGIQLIDLLPSFDGEKSLRITSPKELSSKDKQSLEKIISKF